MKRKLVKQGTSTMMISLPSKWIKANKLDKGSEVDVEENGSNIIISPEKENVKSEIGIELKDLTESSIRTFITNTYRMGYDKVNVKFQNPDQFRILKKVVESRLLGFEIIKRDKGICIIENITEPSQEQFNSILQKIFLNIETLFEITEKRFDNIKVEEDFEEVEEKIQQYDNFCRRVISKKKLIDDKSEFWWTFLTLLIHAQREIYLLNKTINKKVNISSKTKELLKDCSEVFSKLKEAYLKKELNAISTIHSKEKAIIYNKGYKMIENSKEAVILYHILSSARQLYLCSSPLLGIIM